MTISHNVYVYFYIVQIIIWYVFSIKSLNIPSTFSERALWILNQEIFLKTVITSLLWIPNLYKSYFITNHFLLKLLCVFNAD